jgi:uncharacterized membrane protein
LTVCECPTRAPAVVLVMVQVEEIRHHFLLTRTAFLVFYGAVVMYYVAFVPYDWSVEAHLALAAALWLLVASYGAIVLHLNSDYAPGEMTPLLEV